MNLPPRTPSSVHAIRTVSAILAGLIGLVGVTACSGSSPAVTTAQAVVGTSVAGTSVAGTSVGGTSVAGSAVAGSAGAAPTTIPSSRAVTSVPVGPAGASSSPPVATAGTSPTSSAQREVNPAGDIPDNQAFVPYTPSAGKFTVTVPEGWARTETATGVLFTDKYNSIRVDTRATTAPPTVASIRASEVPALRGSVANFVLGDVTTVTRKAGTAVLLTYHADTPPNAVTGKVTTAAFERYVFFKAGTEAVITVGAPVGGDNVDPWRKVTDSFSWSA